MGNGIEIGVIDNIFGMDVLKIKDGDLENSELIGKLIVLKRGEDRRMTGGLETLARYIQLSKNFTPTWVRHNHKFPIPIGEYVPIFDETWLYFLGVADPLVITRKSPMDYKL